MTQIDTKRHIFTDIKPIEMLNESNKNAEKTSQELFEALKQRLPHGAMVEIAKRVKMSDDYVRNFFAGMYSLDTKMSQKILDTTIIYLGEVTENKDIAEAKIEKIINDFPIVKKPTVETQKFDKEF